MDEKIHFKITHRGVTRRFALFSTERDLLHSLQTRVTIITGADDLSLFWKDEDSFIVLDNEDDLLTAIEYAQTQNKLACISLVTETDLSGSAKRVVSAQESAAAYDNYAFVCQQCRCFLAPSNGGRFMCTICPCFDLCAQCLGKNEHENHAFVRILNAETLVPMVKARDEREEKPARFFTDCSPKFVVNQIEEVNYDNIHQPDYAIALENPITQQRPEERRGAEQDNRDADKRERRGREECERFDDRRGYSMDRDKRGRNERARGDDRYDDRRDYRDKCRPDDSDDNEPPRREFYASKYGGDRIFEQGGWRADRRREEEEERCRKRDDRNDRYDDEYGRYEGCYRNRQDERQEEEEKHRRTESDGPRGFDWETQYSRKNHPRFNRQPNYGSGRGRGGYGRPPNYNEDATRERINEQRRHFDNGRENLNGNSTRGMERRGRDGRWETPSRDAGRDQRGCDQAEMYEKAAHVPAHMALDVIEELHGLREVWEMDDRILQYLRHLEDNIYDLERHPPIFTDSDYDEYLIGNVAVDLRKHLTSVAMAIREVRWSRELASGVLKERKRFLKSAIEELTDGKEYASFVQKLRPILLTSKYTRRGGDVQGNWDTEYVGFMVPDPLRDYAEPVRVASANPLEEGAFARVPHGRDA